MKRTGLIFAMAFTALVSLTAREYRGVAGFRAGERSYAMKDYMKNTSGLSDGLFGVNHTAGNRNGLKSPAVESDITYKDDLLIHREFYLGARSFGKGTPQFEEIIIDRVPGFFSDDPAALNNTAAALIRKDETGTAKHYPERYRNA